MTEKQLKSRVRELIHQSLNNLRLDKMVDSIAEHNKKAISMAEGDNLPTKIVCAIAKQLAFDYHPLSPEMQTKRKIQRLYFDIKIDPLKVSPTTKNNGDQAFQFHPNILCCSCGESMTHAYDHLVCMHPGCSNFNRGYALPTIVLKRTLI